MRFLALVLLVTGCASHVPHSIPLAQPRVLWVWTSPDDTPKVSPYLAQQWKQYPLSPQQSTPLIITIAQDVDPREARETLLSFGAAWVVRVTTEPAGAGTLHARPTEDQARTLFAMLPNEALMFVVALPIVTRVDGASSYPLPTYAPEIDRRLGGELRRLLATTGPARPYTVAGIGDMAGCLDDERKQALRAIGVHVHSVIAAATCSRTIFTYVAPLTKILELAAFPWITQLTGSDPYRSGKDVKEENEAG